MKLPTREEFVKAAKESRVYPTMSDEDLGKMYDLLTGPSEAFVDALKDWAKDFEKKI